MPRTKKTTTKKVAPKTKKLTSKKAPKKVIKSATKKKVSPKREPVKKIVPVKKRVAKRLTPKKPAEKKEINMAGIDEILHDLDDLDDLEELGVDVKPQKKEEKKSLPNMGFSSVPKFNSMLKVKPDLSLKKKKKRITPLRRSVNVYRSMALFFIILTIGLLGAVFYFYFSKVTIVITPNKEKLTDVVAVDIYDKEKSVDSEVVGDKIPGIVEQVEIEEEKVYKSTGVKTMGEEVTGKVTIVNEYSKNQPLVATTRLLSPDKKLFRINKTINVPANGSVEVEIYADDPGPKMAVNPTKFTIPGLWSGLQDKIYAVSRDRFVYKEKQEKHISQEDIDSVAVDLRRALVEKAEKELGNNYKNFNKVIYSIDENSISIDIKAKLGEKKDEFLAKIVGSVNVVAFSGETLNMIAKKKLLALVPSTKELLGFKENNLLYRLKKSDYKNGTASVSAELEADMSIKDGTSLIDRKKIISLSQTQLEDYLDGFKEIAGYEVNFVPGFIKRVPNLADRIFIKIRK